MDCCLCEKEIEETDERIRITSTKGESYAHERCWIKTLDISRRNWYV